MELALDQARTRLALEEARALGLSDGTVVLLEGWMPVQHQDALEKVLQDFACAVQELSLIHIWEKLLVLTWVRQTLA